jgi:hypothetical protein
MVENPNNTNKKLFSFVCFFVKKDYCQQNEWFTWIMGNTDIGKHSKWKEKAVSGS